jgi:hypothetical protein
MLIRAIGTGDEERLVAVRSTGAGKENVPRRVRASVTHRASCCSRRLVRIEVAANGDRAVGAGWGCIRCRDRTSNTDEGQ